MPEQVDGSKIRTSRQTPSFTITAAGERVTLDNSGEARAAYGLVQSQDPAAGTANPAQNGEVLDQSPSAGTLQAPGTVVRIIPFPNVEGLTGAKAEAVLTNAGFKVTVKFVPFSGDFFDIVSEQIPRPGTRLPLGSVVEIHVNRFRAG